MHFILLSTNQKKNPISTISGTCFHVSLQFLQFALIFSTKSISLRFCEVDFTGKYISVISGACFHVLYNFWTWFHVLYDFNLSAIFNTTLILTFFHILIMKKNPF